MPNLAAYTIIAAQRRPGKPPTELRQCVVVEKVAPGSAAEHAGVRAGDLLYRVNGERAAQADLLAAFPATTAGCQYEFCCPATREQLCVNATITPLGLRVRKTREAIAAEVRQGQPDFADLAWLWTVGEWQLLAELSDRAMYPRGPWAWLTARFGKRRRDCPALLLRGAALIELGEVQRGRELVREYQDQYVLDWTTDFAAMGRYYEGMQALADGEQQAALPLLHDAFAADPNPRIATAIEHLAGVRPAVVRPWTGKPFPCHYRLRPEGADRGYRWTRPWRGWAPNRS